MDYFLQSIRDSNPNPWLDRPISSPLDQWTIKKPSQDFVLPGRVGLIDFVVPLKNVNNLVYHACTKKASNLVLLDWTHK